MKISTIKIPKPTFIIVRNYPNAIINVHTESSTKEPDAVGRWKIKYFNFVPKEYARP